LTTTGRGEEDNFLWKRSDFAVETETAGWKPLHDDDAVDTRSSRGNNFIVLLIIIIIIIMIP
jgi:t-SNARE complex subunit (syntaxin)